MSTQEYAAAVATPPRNPDGTPRHVKVGASGQLVTTADTGELITLPTTSQQQAQARAKRARQRQQRKSRTDLATSVTAELKRTRQELARAAAATARARAMQATLASQQPRRYNLRTRQPQQLRAVAATPNTIREVHTGDICENDQDDQTESDNDDMWAGMQLCGPLSDSDAEAATRTAITTVATPPDGRDIFAHMQIVPYQFNQ